MSAFNIQFGSKRRVIKRGKYKENVWWTQPSYPRDIVEKSPESLTGCYSFEKTWSRLAKGSKLLAYRRARCFAIAAKAYTTKSQVRTSYVFLAGPKGFIP